MRMGLLYVCTIGFFVFFLLVFFFSSSSDNIVIYVCWCIIYSHSQM